MFSPKSLVLCGLAAFMSLPTTSMAYVQDFVTPDTAAPGASITTTFELGSYISNWVDYGVVIGIAKTTETCADCIGQELTWTDIKGAALEASNDEFPVTVTIPTTLATGDYVLTAGVMYLVGASGVVGVKFFNSNVTIS